MVNWILRHSFGFIVVIPGGNKRCEAEGNVETIGQKPKEIRSNPVSGNGKGLSGGL